MPTEVAGEASLGDLVLDHGENLDVAVPGLVSQQRKEAGDIACAYKGQEDENLEVIFWSYFKCSVHRLEFGGNESLHCFLSPKQYNLALWVTTYNLVFHVP